MARHLLRLAPSADPACSAALRAAAGGASARGDAGAAAHYPRRAVEEPPSEEDRGAVLYELGVAEATDRQRDSFDSHLREAMAETRDPGRRAQIALALGRAWASFGDFRSSAAVLDEALRGLDVPDGELGVALEAELLAMSFHEFTSTRLGTPHWDRRFAQLEWHLRNVYRKLDVGSRGESVWHRDPDGRWTFFQDVAPASPVPGRMADFRIPQRGVFAIGQACFR